MTIMNLAEYLYEAGNIHKINETNEWDQLMVLCADRLSQMTRAYHDIEAVTTLLEEKERDLELAARIGQSLLEKNKALEKQNTEQEAELTTATEKVKQLKHDLVTKETLLQTYQEQESAAGTPESERLQLGVGQINIDGLQKRVQKLEEENLSLLSQSALLQTDTALAEEKEVSLVNDCVRQLKDYKVQVQALQEDAISKSDINLRQQEEITTLTGKIISQDGHIKKLTEENVALTTRLQAAQEAQHELAGEIRDLETRNNELEALIHELQDEVKLLKKKTKPGFIRHHASYNSPFLPEGSLALELEDSIRKEAPCPPGFTPKERRQHSKRVMQTARIVKRAQKSTSSTTNHSPNASNGNESCESIAGSSIHSSLYLSEGELSETGYGADVDSVYGSSSVLGRPGLPGSNDLETALRRLTLQRNQESLDRDIHRRHTFRSDGTDTPTSCRTPDSTASLGSYSNLSDFSRLSSISTQYRIPGKLQIVKPLEGSHTLHQWKRLATPHLGGVLEHRPGIQHKGDLSNNDTEEEEIYSLSDYEEDDDFSLHLGKCMEQTSGIYTFTTAKIMHPSDEYGTPAVPTGPSLFAELNTAGMTMSSATTVTASPLCTAPSTQVYMTSTPRPTPSISTTPRCAITTSYTTLQSSTNISQSYAKLSDCGTSTFSMSASLARGLHERGVQEGRPSPRYGNIVTETISSSTQSQTSVLYSTPKTSVTTPSTESENAYLQLADKVKDIGLNSILNIANKSGITPVQVDPFDSGLNVIMSIKRNRCAVNRCMAEKASQTIRYSRYPRHVKMTAKSSGRNQGLGLAAAGIPSTVHEERQREEEEEDEVLKTLLPSIIVAPKRPNTLDLQSTKSSPLGATAVSAPSSSKCGLYAPGSVASLTSGVTVSGNTVSNGLLAHLSSIYIRTKDLLGGAADLSDNETT